MERNRAFDILKFFFTLVIVIHHSHVMDGALVRGYIPVEFFFIVSGYFIANTYYTNPNLSIAQYFGRRARKLLPEYWMSLIILMVLFLILGMSLPYKSFVAVICDFLMMQNLGLPGIDGINYPAWYLSVLMYGGLLIYALIKKIQSKHFNAVAAAIISIVYGCLISNSWYIEQWNTVGLFYVPLWRGIADMLIGCLLYKIPSPGKVLGRVLECISFPTIVVLLFSHAPVDYLAVVAMILLVYLIKAGTSLLSIIGSNRIFNHLNKYQYSIYLNHAAVLLFGDKILLYDWKVNVAIVVIISIVFGAIAYYARQVYTVFRHEKNI